MMTWLPVVILAVAQVIARLVGIATVVWQERARANSHCAQMRAASVSGVVLLERRRDGTSLMVIPQHPTTRGGEHAGGHRSSEEVPVT